MTVQEMEKGFQEIWALYKETDRKFKETDERLSRKIAQTQDAVNRLTGKWGLFVEGLVLPSVKRLFNERGILIDKVYQRVKVRKEFGGMEIDILGIDHGFAALVEVKSTLTVDDVKEHLQRLSEFKKYFPEYADKNVVGAVAGIVIDEDADRYAYKQGLFVIAQNGETVEFLNDAGFEPKLW